MEFKFIIRKHILIILRYEYLFEYVINIKLINAKVNAKVINAKVNDKVINTKIINVKTMNLNK